MTDHKTIYLGDGAYASFDGYGFELTTSDGIRVTNRIYLEPDVLFTLMRYTQRMRGEPTDD